MRIAYETWNPRMADVILRSCAVHGHNHWSGHTSKSFGGRFYCPGYLRDDLLATFDPQPYREGEANLDLSVRLIDGGYPTPDTPLVVLKRNGDELLVRPLGMPEVEPRTVTIGECWPYRYIPPSRRQCWT